MSDEEYVMMSENNSDKDDSVVIPQTTTTKYVIKESDLQKMSPEYYDNLKGILLNQYDNTEIPDFLLFGCKFFLIPEYSIHQFQPINSNDIFSFHSKKFDIRKYNYKPMYIQIIDHVEGWCILEIIDAKNKPFYFYFYCIPYEQNPISNQLSYDVRYSKSFYSLLSSIYNII
jgi:hypothetical protein